MKADFPYARSVIVVRNTRCLKKSNRCTTETHYYLSSAPPDQYRPHQWLGLIRGHWAGVEIRNHWKRDVVFGEDGSRSRAPNLLANLALIRSALLAALAQHFPETASPAVLQELACKTHLSLRILCS